MFRHTKLCIQFWNSFSAFLHKYELFQFLNYMKTIFSLTLWKVLTEICSQILNYIFFYFYHKNRIKLPNIVFFFQFQIHATSTKPAHQMTNPAFQLQTSAHWISSHSLITPLNIPTKNKKKNNHIYYINIKTITY